MAYLTTVLTLKNCTDVDLNVRHGLVSMSQLHIISLLPPWSCSRSYTMSILTVSVDSTF